MIQQEQSEHKMCFNFHSHCRHWSLRMVTMDSKVQIFTLNIDDYVRSHMEVRFGSVGQIGLKMVSRNVLKKSDLKKVPDLSHLGPIWPTLEPNLPPSLTDSYNEYFNRSLYYNERHQQLRYAYMGRDWKKNESR